MVLASGRRIERHRVSITTTTITSTTTIITITRIIAGFEQLTHRPCSCLSQFVFVIALVDFVLQMLAKPPRGVGELNAGVGVSVGVGVACFDVRVKIGR